ncbi:carbohydrate sulfotransferase 14-like [Diadema antillarum]|uniref:carbohydrate sulfotransferase 14-like n=1 Tax=Diadema antillarum TaxID=105358 RepID=UPI003A84DD82
MSRMSAQRVTSILLIVITSSVLIFTFKSSSTSDQDRGKELVGAPDRHGDEDQRNLGQEEKVMQQAEDIKVDDGHDIEVNDGHDIEGDDVYNIDAVQVRRRQILNQACNRLGQSRNLPPVAWETTVHFLASDKYRLLFCFAPKVSCTTWKSIMSALYQDDKRAKPGRFLKMNTIHDAYDVMRRWRNYAKVLFAREPLERALSAYLDKFVLGPERASWERKFGSVMVKRYRNASTDKLTYPFKTPIRFDEFIRFITDNGPKATMTQQTDHWLPVSRFTSPCQIDYTFLGHYETLQYDGPYVINHFNLSSVVTFPEVHSSRSRDRLVEAYAKVPTNLIHRLVDYYKMDYELFGYSANEILDVILEGRR